MSETVMSTIRDPSPTPLFGLPGSPPVFALTPTLPVSFLANWGGSPGLIYADIHTFSH